MTTNDNVRYIREIDYGVKHSAIYKVEILDKKRNIDDILVCGIKYLEKCWEVCIEGAFVPDRVAGPTRTVYASDLYKEFYDALAGAVDAAQYEAKDARRNAQKMYDIISDAQKKIKHQQNRMRFAAEILKNAEPIL